MKKIIMGALIALTTVSAFAAELPKNFKLNHFYLEEKAGVLNGNSDAAIKAGYRHIFKNNKAPMFSDLSFSGSLRTQLDLNAKINVLHKKDEYSLMSFGAGVERFYRDYDKTDYTYSEEPDEITLYTEHIEDFKVSQYIEIGYGFTAFENRAFFEANVKAGTEKNSIEINAEYAPKSFKGLCLTATAAYSSINIEGIDSKKTVPTFMIGLVQSF